VRMLQTFLPVSVAFLPSCLPQPRRNFPVCFKWRSERWAGAQGNFCLAQGIGGSQPLRPGQRAWPMGLAAVRAGDRRTQAEEQRVLALCYLESGFARVICLDCFVRKKQKAEYRIPQQKCDVC